MKTNVKAVGLARKMKTLTIAFAAITLVATTLAASAAEAAAVAHFTAKGGFASAYFLDTTTGAYGGLFVWQGGAPNSPQTFVSFYEGKCDDVTAECSGITGYGLIPNRDFSVQAPTKAATLDTDTVGNPNFYAYQWTYNYVDFTYTETQIPGGRLAFSFQKSGISSYTFQGTTTITYLNTVSKQVGRSTSSDAVASGTLFGSLVSINYASIGTNHGTSIDITRN
jgi:hypothetical protein